MKIAVFYVINNARRAGYGGVDYSTPSPAVFSQTDNYDENGVYLGSSYGGTKYTYGYDDTGFVTSIGYGGTADNATVTPLLQYSYNSSGSFIGSNKLSRKTYTNGDIENYTYTSVSSGSKTQIEHINENGSSLGVHTYNYNTNGALTSQEYRKNGYTQVSYNYGELDNAEEQTLTINGLEFYFQYTNNYDTLNNRIKRSQIYSLISCVTTDYKTLDYSYNAEGQLSEFSYDAYDVEYTYDKMGRLTNRLAPMSYGYQDIQNENYVYKTYGNGYTTNLLTSIDDQTYENNDRTATYDANGYVTSITYNGNTYTYTYDGVGRLASETIGGATQTYTYDSQNNVQKTGLTYTNGKLTAVNGAQIVYDAMGNPTKYKGNTFNWEQGRKLASGTMNGNNFAYNYDGNGMRYEKKVNGVKTNYYYDGSQLLMESKNGSRIWYIYGVMGIEGMMVESGSWQNSAYYFDKNTLGDIVAIRDEDGNVVATYEYDAWGNITYQSGSMADINPFRYRGYYYDTETGFYYLQTRYYDPTICRFINADNYELVAELSSVVGQLNMYAYCGNNPIMYTDPTGEIAGWLIVAAILLFTPVGGTVAQAATSIVSYAGMAVASIWDTDIRADMNAINWNPFNTNGNTVLGSNKVSFYKGVPVFLKNSGRSGSFYAISLNRNDGITGLNHERGHNWQAMMMGIGTYGFTVGIPSPLCLGGWDANGLYYYAPWETMADILGGVKYRYGTKIPQAQVKNAWIYYGISSLCFPFTALYW